MIKSNIKILQDNEPTCREFNENEFIQYIRGNSLNVLNNMDISDDQIIKYVEHFDRNVLLNHNMSEYLVLSLIDNKYIHPNTLFILNMSTYGNLSQATIDKYFEHINKERLATLQITCGMLSELEVCKLIDNDRLFISWNLLSTMCFTIEFLEKYKKNINWYIYFTTNGISDTIRDRFVDIVEKYGSNINAEVDTSNTRCKQFEKLIDFKVEDIDDLLNKYINK